MINFRAFKRTTIRIVDEKPAEVYRQLVINDEKFDFKSSDTQLEESSEGTNEEKDRSVEFDTYDKDSLRSKHIDNSLQTNLDINQLLKNLRSIQYKAQDILDEQGYNSLFLTLGMLEWYDAEQSDKLNKSPLILVPVKVFKNQVNWISN